jgi:polyisoprenoid-binding protein YceI
MQRLVLLALLVFLLIPAMLVAQEGEAAEEAEIDTTPVVREAFAGDADGMRNWGTVESVGQLQATLWLVPELSARAVVRRDDIADSLVVELTIDLTKLTTGFEARDTLVLSKKFLNFDSLTTATFSLLSVSSAKDPELRNEQPIKVSGVGELRIGNVIDTVAAEMQFTYLEENKVTQQRLPGNLLHLQMSYSFKLSDFGVKIPKEALLRLADQLTVQADMFLSSTVEP